MKVGDFPYIFSKKSRWYFLLEGWSLDWSQTLPMPLESPESHTLKRSTGRPPARFSSHSDMRSTGKVWLLQSRTYMIYDIWYIYIYLGPPNTINIKVLKIMVQVQNTILWVHGGSRQLYSKESSCFHCLGKFGNIRKSPSYDFDGVSHFLQETPWFWLYKPNSVGAGPQPCK